MKKFIIFTILASLCFIKAFSSSSSSLTTIEGDFVATAKYKALEFRLSQVEGSEKFYKSQASAMHKSLSSTGDILLGVQREHKKLQAQYQRLLEEKETLSLRPETSVYERATSRVSELDEENKSLLALKVQWELEKAELEKKAFSEVTPLIPRVKATRGCWYGFTQIFSGIGSMLKGCFIGDCCGAGPCSWCRKPSHHDDLIQ